MSANNESMESQIKIISTLSLANSDTREDTLESVILTSIFEAGKLKFEELNEYINEFFGFKPYLNELTDIIDVLIKDEKISLQDDFYVLIPFEKEKRKSEAIYLRDKEKNRYRNFKDFLLEEDSNFSEDGIKQIWNVFTEYIYNNFFDYGEDAIKKLHPNIEYNGSNKHDEDHLQHAFKSLNSKRQCELFKITIAKFPDYASSEDINYLNNLAERALSFKSLGINPKLSKLHRDLSGIDWILYLDTNVLYSILDLHTHPENDSVRSLVQLINGNKDDFKIEMRYTPLTYKELVAKKDDFNLLNDQLPDSSIRALLKSESLDIYSQKFYESILKSRNNTLHPSKKIELAQVTLNQLNVIIAQNQARIKKIGDEYLEAKTSEYFEFIGDKNKRKNEIAEQTGTEFYEIFKSNSQAKHDITLREIVIDSRASISRKSTMSTFHSMKYFGVTLDSNLIEFDNKKFNLSTDEKEFPIFFKPSFLLNRLTKLLPLQADDYKIAFIKSITSSGFYRSKLKSDEILKIVNYLKQIGVSDEKVIYSMITQKLFIKNFHSTENDSTKFAFVQSELDRQLTEREKELERQKIISKENKEIAEKSSLKAKQIILKNDQAEDHLKILIKEIQKLKTENKKNESQQQTLITKQPEINFESSTMKKNLDSVNKKLIKKIENEIEIYKSKELKKWKNKILWHLLWVLPVLIVCSYYFIFPYTSTNINLNNFIKKLCVGIPSILIPTSIAIVLLKFFNQKNINAFEEKIKIPEDLENELSDIIEKGNE